MGISKAERERRAQDRSEAIEQLRDWILDPRAIDVYTDVRWVSSAGGATWVVTVLLPYVDTHNGFRPAILNISRRVATILGYRYSDARGGVLVTGGGVDIGYNTVFELARIVWWDDPRFTAERAEGRLGYILGHRGL